MSRTNRHLVPTSIALPQPLIDWLEEEAATHGLSRNAHVILLLSVLKQTGSNANLQRRVAALEAAICRNEEK